MGFRRKFTHIAVDYSGFDLDFPAFINFRNRFRMGKGNPPYNFLIGNGVSFTRDGELYVLDNLFPFFFDSCSFLCVGLIGDLEHSPPTRMQLSCLYNFLDRKAIEHDIPTSNISGVDELLENGKYKMRYLDMNSVRSQHQSRINSSIDRMNSYLYSAV